MKKHTRILTSIVALIFSCAGWAALPAANPDLPISKQMQKIERQDEKTIKDTTKLMAHLSFAAQAIDMKLKKSAMYNLAQAQKLSKVLERSRPEIISKYDFKYGKVRYSVEGVDRDYYIPVADDVYVEGQFDDKQIGKKNPKIDETGLAIVHANLQLNLNDVTTAIRSAEKYTKAGKYDEARNALGDIYKSAITSEEVVTNPVWTVWSNVVLAQNFMKGKEFKSARFALKSAKSDLEKLEKDKILAKSEDEAKVLKSEIESIEKTLDEKNPTLIKKLEAKLSGWGHKVKEWL